MSFKIGATWYWEHWRNEKLLAEWSDKNIVPDAAVDYLLDATLNGATPIEDWYVAPFENDYTPIAGNTYATPGYTECTAYDEATRPLWDNDAVSSQTISNQTNKSVFTFTANKDIYGAGLVGGGTAATTKSDTAGGGTLFSSSQFSSGMVSLATDDVLKVIVYIAGASF